MDKRTTVYEDNAGGINIYHMVDGETVWAAHYYGMEYDGHTAPELAAMDFTGLTVQHLDPVKEGWEYGEADCLLDPKDEDGDLIADSRLYNGKVDDMFYDPRYLGIAGTQFYRAIIPEDEGC